jgi:hypothetical protein
MDYLCKIHNLNRFDHKEMFQGKEIIIPAGKHIMMDYEEANRFLGQMFPIKWEKGGVQDPRSYKWLQMDKDDKRRCELALRNEAEEKSKKLFVCHSCGKEFVVKKALMDHIKREHLDDLADENVKEALQEGD